MAKTKTLTREERVVRAAFINESAQRHPGRDYTIAIREGVAAFNAHRARGKRTQNETASKQAPKLGKRVRRRIAKAVAETLTAAQAPKPQAAAAPTTGSKPAPSKPLHEMDPDGLAAATAGTLTAGRSSPFWGPRETAPAAPVTESAAAAQPDAPLHTLDSDGLAAHAAATFGAYGRASGFRSPGWQG